MKEVERSFQYAHKFSVPKEDEVSVRSECGGVEVLKDLVRELNPSKPLCPVCFKEK